MYDCNWLFLHSGFILFFSWYYITERHPSISKTSDISNSASLKESRIDLNAEPVKSTKYQKITTSSNATTTPPRQDSLDDVPNIQCNNNTQTTASTTNNNNEDVSISPEPILIRRNSIVN